LATTFGELDPGGAVACGSAATASSTRASSAARAWKPESEPPNNNEKTIVHLRLLRPSSATTDLDIAMSTKAKATLAGTVLGTIGIVYFVHYQQVADKAVSRHLTILWRVSF
jgi:hypothetical protein